LILAAVIIGASLIDERRAVFWLGSLYLVLLILSRFLEYETSLLVKSAAFLACGVAVILAGISYEKYLRRHIRRIAAETGGNGI
jgi:general stress protein CsbA